MNYNVVGLVDSSGNLKERYEYTPYGERTVFRSYGSADPELMSSVLESQRVTQSGIAKPYGLCDVGYQGLFFEKEFNKVYVRSRYLDPTLMRMIGPDKKGYVDGNNRNEWEGSNPVNRLDPSGKSALIWALRGADYLWPSETTQAIIKHLEVVDMAPVRAVKSMVENFPGKDAAVRGLQLTWKLEPPPLPQHPLPGAIRMGVHSTPAAGEIRGDPTIMNFVENYWPEIRKSIEEGRYGDAYGHVAWYIQAENPAYGGFVRVGERVIRTGSYTLQDTSELGDQVFQDVLLIEGIRGGAKAPAPRSGVVGEPPPTAPSAVASGEAYSSGQAQGVLIRAADGKIYSVAFQTELSGTSYPGVSRALHVQEANQALLQTMEGDAAFAQAVRSGGINLQRTATGLAPRTPPVGWTWHHAQPPGIMQLVPRPQHTAGSIWWDTMHPGGQGGYAIWGQ